MDTVEDLTVSVNEALKGLGRPLRTREEVRGFIGDGARQLVKDSLGPGHEVLTDQALDLFAAHYEEHCAHKSALYPGVARALGRLSAYRLAVVTNKPASPSRRLLEHLEIWTPFSALVGGDTLKVKKPDPGPVLEACRLLNVDPAAALMVGDSPGDMKAGRAAGARVVGVSYGYRPAQELRAAGAEVVVERIDDLVVMLSDGLSLPDSSGEVKRII